MASNINTNVPSLTAPTVESVRTNFATIKAEIEALQAGGGVGNGNVVKTITFGEASSPISVLTGNVIVVSALTGNLVVGNLIDTTPNRFYTFVFTQGGSGGYTVSFQNGISFGSGALGKKLIVQFFYDGVDFLQVFGGA
jgi:hypothetical protein